MDDREKLSPPLLYGGTVLLAALALWATLYFFYALFAVGNAITSQANVFLFPKGAFYLLGVGIGLSALLYAGVYESLLHKRMSKALSRRISGVVVAGLALLISVPHGSHYLVDAFAEEKGYRVCEEASSQWLHVKTVVYAKNRESCHLPQ